MCNTLHGSINSSVLSLVSSFMLFKYSISRDKHIYQPLALFFAFVGLMQIYDAIFWLNQTHNFTNYAFTKIAMITNHLQPIVLAYLISIHFGLNTLTQIILLIYILYGTLYSIVAFHQIKYTLVTSRSHPVLDWEWNSLPQQNSPVMYFLFLLSLTIISFNLPNPFNYIMAAINLLTFVYSYKTQKTSTIGKHWCIIAAYIPILLLGVQFVF